jgi:hypothetical protein
MTVQIRSRCHGEVLECPTTVCIVDSGFLHDSLCDPIIKVSDWQWAGRIEAG